MLEYLQAQPQWLHLLLPHQDQKSFQILRYQTSFLLWLTHSGSHIGQPQKQTQKSLSSPHQPNLMLFQMIQMIQVDPKNQKELIRAFKMNSTKKLIKIFFRINHSFLRNKCSYFRFKKINISILKIDEKSLLRNYCI